MTTITASVVADSIGEKAPRLTTLLLRYPRIIHPEFMTHRVFSRNAASHRAIPVMKLIQNIMDDPFIPVVWTREQKGMSGIEDLSLAEIEDAKSLWMAARNSAVHHAHNLVRRGFHKSIINRVLEPYSHITVVVTSTQWSNFFGLRLKGAEPHMEILADRIFSAIDLSKPQLLQPGQWHLPFVSVTDKMKSTEDARMLSVARCASTSYKTVEGFDMTVERARIIGEKLMGPPIHASPFEHLATPDAGYKGFNGNFAPGWVQLRKTMKGECL